MTRRKRNMMGSVTRDRSSRGFFTVRRTTLMDTTRTDSRCTLQFLRRFATLQRPRTRPAMLRHQSCSRTPGHSSRPHFCLTVLNGEATGLIATWLSALREIRSGNLFPVRQRMQHEKLRTCSRSVLIARIFRVSKFLGYLSIRYKTRKLNFSFPLLFNVSLSKLATEIRYLFVSSTLQSNWT